MFAIRFIPLLTLLLSACAPFKAGSTMAAWLHTPPPVITATATSNPFLADLSAEEIQSIKAEAMRTYGPSWQRIAKRSRYVRQPLLVALEQCNAPLELQTIPVVESGYNPYAESEVGAAGLWQLMPETASDLHIQSNSQVDGRRDIAASTAGAARFLLKQHARFGNWPLAFAAYHLGPGAVQRRLHHHPWQSGDGLKTLPLPPVTRSYIRHILGLIALQHDGQLLLPPPYPTSTVVIRSPVDLERLRNAAGIPPNQLFRFNPKLARMQYFQDRPKPLSLRISQQRVGRVQEMIASEASEKLNIHVLHSESIGDISRRYRVSVHVLRKENPKLGLGIKSGMVISIRAKNLIRAEIVANPLVEPRPGLLTTTTETALNR